MMHSSQRRAQWSRAVALTMIVVCVLSVTGSASADRSCAPPKYPGNGYFTLLKVNNTTCATGGKVALAWYACRLKGGVKGRCRQTVLGFSCSEKRVSIPTEIDARVICHRGSATVLHYYQQNT